MAGLFGFNNYNNPGPGVPKDAPPKAPILVFFEIVQRKFWNLIKINLLFCLFNIPGILLTILVADAAFPNLLSGTAGSDDILFVDFLFKFMIVSVLPLITVGPAQAGLTYVLRNYAREEHAFIWDDFKDCAIKNFKQSLAISGINLLVTAALLLAIKAYKLLNNELLATIGITWIVIMMVIFMMMHLYIYPMLITFELKTGQIYKNSLLFAFARLFPNLGIIVLCMGVFAFSFGMIIPFNQLLGIVLYFLITVSFIGLITNFYANPVLNKYMMKDLKQAEADDDSGEDDEEDYEDDNEVEDPEEE